MLTSDFIAWVAGIVVSLLFSYFPVLNTKFAALTTEAKSGIMIGMMALAGFGIWGAGCAGWIDANLACTTATIPQLVKLIVQALIANQSTFMVSPQTASVKAAKLNGVG
jgi:hypothetical protein